MIIRPILFLTLTPSLLFTQAKTPQSIPPVPRTVDEAVMVLKGQISDENRAWILGNPKNLVSAQLHLGFGTGVRNSFRLWGGNPELLASCGVSHPESCSGIIIDRLWESVRGEADPLVVRKLDCQFRLAELITVDSRRLRRTTMGYFLKRLQQQVDEQVPLHRTELEPGCEAVLQIKVEGKPDRSCWASVGARDPVSLGRLLYGMSNNNSFNVYHAPPELRVVFYRECHWRNMPPPPPEWKLKEMQQTKPDTTQ